MTRTIKLEDIDITYSEEGPLSLFFHLIEEPGGSFGLYLTSAENSFSAVLNAAVFGHVLHTENLLDAMAKFENASFPNNHGNDDIVQ